MPSLCCRKIILPFHLLQRGRLSKDSKSNDRDTGSSLGGNKGNKDIN